MNNGDGKNNHLKFKKSVETLDKYALKKTKILRVNHKSHINKKLKKAIRKGSQLKNKENKTKDYKDILKCKKQFNYAVNLNNQPKQEHFDRKCFIDSKSFWKSCKSYFSNENSFGDLKAASNENSEILTQNIKIGKTFNSYFESITDSLELFDCPLQSNIPNRKVQNIVKIFPIVLELLKSSNNLC